MNGGVRNVKRVSIFWVMSIYVLYGLFQRCMSMSELERQKIIECSQTAIDHALKLCAVNSDSDAVHTYKYIFALGMQICRA